MSGLAPLSHYPNNTPAPQAPTATTTTNIPDITLSHGRIYRISIDIFFNSGDPRVERAIERQVYLPF
jgi:hypothetical protein